jgi:hypothetical protein
MPRLTPAAMMTFDMPHRQGHCDGIDPDSDIG